MFGFETVSGERRRGRAWRLLLLAFALLLAQSHALEHAVSHELAKDRLDHACLLCAAADQLGSGLPALPPPPAAPAIHAVAAPSPAMRCDALPVHFYGARAPPVSRLS